MRSLSKEDLDPDEFLKKHVDISCGDILRREVKVDGPPVVHIPFEQDFRAEIYELWCPRHKVTSKKYYLVVGERVLFGG